MLKMGLLVCLMLRGIICNYKKKKKNGGIICNAQGISRLLGIIQLSHKINSCIIIKSNIS